MESTAMLLWFVSKIYTERHSMIVKSKNHKIISSIVWVLGLPDVFYYLIFKFPKDREMMKVIDKVTKQRKLDVYF